MEKIVLTMPVRNGADTIEAAIQSFLFQRKIRRQKLLLIANDGSTDRTNNILEQYKQLPEIEVINVKINNIGKIRNFLIDYVKANYPEAVLVGRLDADDLLASDLVLQEVEQLFDKENFDVLFCGNKQQRNGKLLTWQNKADARMLDYRYLKKRVKQMAEGNPQAELPSCNTFIHPTVFIKYPSIKSAEDHWFTVLLLLAKHQLKITIAENLIYCIYTINGCTTQQNQQNRIYLDSREKLFLFLEHQLVNYEPTKQG